MEEEEVFETHTEREVESVCFLSPREEEEEEEEEEELWYTLVVFSHTHTQHTTHTHNTHRERKKERDPIAISEEDGVLYIKALLLPVSSARAKNRYIRCG